MYTVRLLVAGLVVGALTVAVRADDKKADNGKLLVGKWEATKVDKDAGLPEGAVSEFTKDGKCKVSFKIEGKEMSHEGTYTVDGDTFTIVMKGSGTGEEKIKITIKKISDSECVTEHDGKTIEWKRKK